MLYEWATLHKVGRIWWIAGVVVLAAALLALSWKFFPPGTVDYVEGIGEAIIPELLQPVWLGFGIIVGLGLLLGAVSRRLAMATGFLYIGIPTFALIVVEWARYDIVFWLMLVTWATDICAYFAGRRIGGPKLAPRVSPNKTWAGLVGGVIGAAIVGGVVAWAIDLPPGLPICGRADGGARAARRSLRKLGEAALPASRIARTSFPAMAACSTGSTACCP